MSAGPQEPYYGYDQDKNLTALKVLAENKYAYDGNDNRTRRLAGGEDETYTYDPRNRLTSQTKGGVTTPLVYDDAGNLLRDGSAAYGYDAFNRTVKVDTFDGNVQVNRYDAEGLRYELEENNRLVQFIFHRQEAVSEQSETETLRLIRGYDLIASDAKSARTYYHYASDELGSTTHIVDEDGAVQNCYVYDAFETVTEQKEAVPNRFKFNGQQMDPVTGQYYLRARFYNPVVARFTQEDVYRGDGLNLYAYCQNNPVIYSDPSGYCSGGEQLAGQRAAGGQLAPQQFLDRMDFEMSRRQGVTINIVFRHWQINEPAEYIFNFCDLWVKSGRDKLLLYKKTVPNSQLSVNDLKNQLLFNGADKGKERKSVTLKSSLKSNNDVVTFYCENNSDYWKELHPDGWGKITSQIVIDLALDKIKESKAYSFNQLVEFVVKLLMSKQVYRVFVQGDSELYFSLDGVYTELQSFRNKKRSFSTSIG